MFGKEKKARENAMKTGAYKEGSMYSKNRCQICGKKLKKQNGKKVTTSRIRDYKVEGEEVFDYNLYSYRTVYKQIPIYEEEYQEGYYYCPVHGTAGVHYEVKRLHF